jgi:hypothetical protein
MQRGWRDCSSVSAFSTTLLNHHSLPSLPHTRAEISDDRWQGVSQRVLTLRFCRTTFHHEDDGGLWAARFERMVFKTPFFEGLLSPSTADTPKSSPASRAAPERRG